MGLSPPGLTRWSVTVFVNVHDDCSFPAEQKVARSGSKRHSETQPAVIRHEDEHEKVTEDDL